MLSVMWSDIVFFIKFDISFIWEKLSGWYSSIQFKKTFSFFKRTKYVWYDIFRFKSLMLSVMWSDIVFSSNLTLVLFERNCRVDTVPFNLKRLFRFSRGRGMFDAIFLIFSRLCCLWCEVILLLSSNLTLVLFERNCRVDTVPFNLKRLFRFSRGRGMFDAIFLGLSRWYFLSCEEIFPITFNFAEYNCGLFTDSTLNLASLWLCECCWFGKLLLGCFPFWTDWWCLSSLKEFCNSRWCRCFMVVLVILGFISLKFILFMKP